MWPLHIRLSECMTKEAGPCAQTLSRIAWPMARFRAKFRSKWRNLHLPLPTLTLPSLLEKYE